MPDFLSNLLISILPNTPSAAPGHASSPGGVFVDDILWKEVYWNSDWVDDTKTDSNKPDNGANDEEDIYSYEDEEDQSVKQYGDWTGVDRDRRSSFLIISALRSEGLV